jgi:hypothetical protein
VFKDAGPPTARERIEPRPLEAGSLEPLDKVVSIGETGAGLELYYPYLRHLGPALGTLVTGGALVGFADRLGAEQGGCARVLKFLMVRSGAKRCYR